MRRFVRIISSRLFIALLLVTLQIALIVWGIYYLSSKFVYLYIILLVISALVVVYLVSKDENSSYKLAWIVPIVLFPLIGGIFYLMYGNKKVPRKLGDSVNHILKGTEHFLPGNSDEMRELQSVSDRAYRQAIYINRCCEMPVYCNTSTHFQSPGEVHFERLIAELEKAKHYIFMEYFIIEPGYMLDTILDILARKAAQGVDVRFIYDDVGSQFTLPNDFLETLRGRGIKVAVFNKISFTPTMFANNRDHRKITVIDGVVGFTGGVNLADEYINRKMRFGNWKDSALMLTGDGVWTFVVMFLQTWLAVNGMGVEDFSKYRPSKEDLAPYLVEDGFVAPYGDSPLTRETIGENVYRNMIDKANRYIYIETPYFIIDDEMLTSITLAAKQGVDVRILVPHIPDKKLVFLVTQAFYPRLIQAGAHVYEYTPGFVHTKACVCDDKYAATGTVNFDYRSFYLHFECGVWMYESSAVNEIRDDFLSAIDVSQEIVAADIAKTRAPKRLLQAVLRMLSPLL